MNELRIGSIVHYQAFGTPGGEYPSAPRAAVVTQLGGIGEDPFVVGLCILNPTGMFFNTRVAYNETPRPGFWSFSS